MEKSYELEKTVPIFRKKIWEKEFILDESN